MAVEVEFVPATYFKRPQCEKPGVVFSKILTIILKAKNALALKYQFKKAKAVFTTLYFLRN